MQDDPNDDVRPEEENNSPGESVFDAYQPNEIQYVIDEDGFPTDHDPPGESDVLPLTPENMCCMAQPAKPGVEALPRCEHYVRQLVPIQDINNRKIMRRMCSHPMFKTLSGAGYDLTDSAVFACEARVPPDPTSLAVMDARDARTEKRSQNPKKFRLFRTEEEAKAGKHTLAEDEHE